MTRRLARFIVCGGLCIGGLLGSLFVSSSARADDEPKLAPNSIYAEGLGAGLLYSVNYERLVIDPLAIRVGLGYWSSSSSSSNGTSSASSSASYLSIPITASYIGVRSGKHALELGGGVTLLYASGAGSSIGVASSGSAFAPIASFFVGYRLHPFHTGFQFRIGAMGLAAKGLALSNPDPTAFGVIPWLYLSLGASF